MADFLADFLGDFLADFLADFLVDFLGDFLANFFADFLMLHVLPERKHYRTYKQERTPDFSDLRTAHNVARTGAPMRCF